MTVGSMKGTTMKPADLKPGDQIKVSDQGWAEVIEPPFVDIGEESAKKWGTAYRPEDDRVMVDVKLDPSIDGWELSTETGAVDHEWLSSTPFHRWRLFYRVDADVVVKS